jgi:hypothetical protein
VKDENSICSRYDNMNRALKSISIVKSCLYKKQISRNVFYMYFKACQCATIKDEVCKGWNVFLYAQKCL